MRPRAFAVLVVSSVLLAACTGARDPSDRRSMPNETVLLATQAGPLAVDVPSGDVVAGARGAVASADGARLYATEPSGSTTTLRTIDAATGATVASTSLRGILGVRVVAWDGARAALMAPLPSGRDPWTPAPRARTTIVVADPSGASSARTYRLAGNYEPEAFSSDGAFLFLIQYLPAQAPSVYRVTKLDLGGGVVDPVLGPYKAPAERMPGTRLEQVPAVDGSKLFTLYTSERPGFAPHDAPVPRNAIVSFVHVLSLDEGWAHCVGLPRVLWHQPASAEAMAVSPDGGTLYLVDADKGVLVTMDTETLELSAPHRVALPPPGDRTTAAISADGRTLFVGTAGGTGAVTAIDTATSTVVHRWSTDGAVSGLGLSLDGARRYVGQTDRLEVLSAANGRALDDVSVPSPGPIEGVSAIAG